MLSSLLCVWTMVVVFFSSINESRCSSTLPTYIVHLDPPTNTNLHRKEDYHEWCMSFLPPAPTKVRAKRLVHIYGEAIHGFAARLTEEEVRHMEKKKGFVSAYLDKLLPLHTTYTSEFLGLTANDPGHPVFGNGGKGTIVGVLDTGVAPNHPSFNGDGIPSPPSKWKGECNLTTTEGNVPTQWCNNKLIGFRVFLQGAMAAGHKNLEETTSFDNVGHGTHTASTVAGSAVGNASMLGEANGTATGMAPGAHLAIYRVCLLNGCYRSDVLKGIDAGIGDGIDVMSISLGGHSRNYYTDPIAIGAFRAMQKGIFVSCSAGNAGPYYYSISNQAPWTLTVGASSTDRRIRSTVKLGDDQELEGETVYQPRDFNSSEALDLVLPNARGGIKGKVVFCMGLDRFFLRVCRNDSMVKMLGGAGTIRVNSMIRGNNTFAGNRTIPSPELKYYDGIKVRKYMGTTDKPSVYILFNHTVFDASPSPSTAFFSSRGPAILNPDILKPDIIGPGMNIIAAFPPTHDSRPEARFSKHSFAFMSGTSMSAPHLSGIAALIKATHWDWSPSAIRSAIMTTANILDRDGKPITNEKYVPADLFAIGAGHVNASNANNPGLIYNITSQDYISFLCQLNYKQPQLVTIVGRKVNCSQFKKILIKDLNYPSISVTMKKRHYKNVTVTRTVTNVGHPNSSYGIKLNPPKGVSITVNPQTLAFSEVNEQITFNITFQREDAVKLYYSQGHLTWVDKENDAVVVRSPISVIFRRF